MPQKHHKLSNTNYDIVNCAITGDLNAIVQHLAKNPPVNTALIAAAEYGHLDCVKLLAPHLTPGDNSMALETAVRQNHTQCALFLIPLSDPKDFSTIIQVAVEHNPDTTIANQLIHAFDAFKDQTISLQIAAYAGKSDFIKLLIPYSDPKDDNSQALYWAVSFNHMECFNLLYPLSDIDIVWDKVQFSPSLFQNPVAERLKQLVESKRTRATLLEHLNFEHNNGTSSPRKI